MLSRSKHPRISIQEWTTKFTALFATPKHDSEEIASSTSSSDKDGTEEIVCDTLNETLVSYFRFEPWNGLWKTELLSKKAWMGRRSPKARSVCQTPVNGAKVVMQTDINRTRDTRQSIIQAQ